MVHQKYLWAACFAGAKLYSAGYHRLQQIHIKIILYTIQPLEHWV